MGSIPRYKRGMRLSVLQSCEKIEVFRRRLEKCEAVETCGGVHSIVRG